jgi:hypothetical protein
MPGRLSPEEKARVVEDSVNWLRNNELKPEDVNEPTLTALDEPRGSTNAEGHIDPTQKKKAIDDAMNWLRNNDPNPADVDDPTAQGRTLLGYPCPAVCLRRRRPEVEDSVNWLRNNE